MVDGGTFLLAVDCGSTNLKAAVFDQYLERLSEVSVGVEYLVNDATRVEFDPEATWCSFVELVHLACRKGGIEPHQLLDVSLASQAQTFVVLDAKDKCLTPFISWMDRRADAEAAEIAGRLGVAFHQHCSFSPPIPQLQVAKLLWLQRREPGLLSASCRILSLPGYLAWRLGGVNAVDVNLAAMGGLYSMVRQHWWPEALTLCGLSTAQLPAIVDVGDAVPLQTSCCEVRLSDGTEVVLAGNDQTSGAFGNNCHSGDMVVTLGTALVAYRHAGQSRGPFHPRGCWGPYPGGGYYELAVRDEGCKALDWAREELLPGANVSEFDDRARRGYRQVLGQTGGCGNEGSTCLFFPEKMRTAAAWSSGGGTEEMAYAVLEGIGFLLRSLIEEELGTCGMPEAVCMTGGGSKSGVWLQILADVMGCRTYRGQGDSLYGAALMALRGACSGREPAAVVEPNAGSAARCDMRYRQWRTCTESTKMAAVNGADGCQVASLDHS